MPATAQAVSSILRRAGFPRSEASPSAIRGMQEFSKGFKAVMDYDGKAVIVTTWNSSLSPYKFGRDEEVAILRKYAEVLEGNGYTVELHDDLRFRPELRVMRD